MLCQECLSLTATLRELDRLVQRPALGRTPLLTLVTANGTAHAPALHTVASDRVVESAGFRPFASDGGGRA
jgi:hypothetical protein